MVIVVRFGKLSSDILFLVLRSESEVPPYGNTIRGASTCNTCPNKVTSI